MVIFVDEAQYLKELKALASELQAIKNQVKEITLSTYLTNNQKNIFPPVEKNTLHFAKKYAIINPNNRAEVIQWLN